VIIFKDIQLEDKPLFDRYFNAKLYMNSEYSFTNTFIWRLSYHFQYAVIHDHLCIVGKYRNQYPFAFAPLALTTFDYEQVIPILAEIFREKGYPLILKSVPEEQKEIIEYQLPGKIIFREDRNNFDYVYLAQQLIDLKGNKFRQKRNHINKFLRNYEFQYEEMSDSNLEECLHTGVKWASKRSNDLTVLEEKRAIEEIIKHFHDLRVTGGVIRIHGEVQAFTVGELLSSDMAVIHIEKANTNYDGAYCMINMMYARSEWSHVTYINREEDMGIPGLRKAKESYNPVKMIKKYTGFYEQEGDYNDPTGC
jgi:hypothetical protein